MRFDLVLDNANVITADEARPRAGSIGILGQRIVAVDDVGRLSASEAATTIDLGGRTVVPGFNDAHNHMQSFGAGLNEVPLHPLFAEGYPSIGCAPCTRPSSDPDNERAGRWAGTEKTECGLHVG